jgi:hypothetical protein
MLIETRLKRVVDDLAHLLREPSFDRKDHGHLQIAEANASRVLKDFNPPPPAPPHRIEGDVPD